MAGSLSHITGDDGRFTMDLIENMGDAEEALAECHQVIAALLASTRLLHRRARLESACAAMAFPIPTAAPVLQSEFWGPDSNRRGTL